MDAPIQRAAQAALRSTRDSLAAVSGRLGDFLSGSEELFLDTGARLAGVEQQARGLLEGARRAAALGSEGGEGTHPAERLDRELSRLDAYLGTTRDAAAGGLQSLSRLAECVEAIARARSAFDTIPPTLRMLGMNTRIENSRSDARNAGMETVAAEVRRLADLVEPRFRAIFQEAEGLAATAGRARTTAAAFLGRQRAWSSELLSETRTALEALRALERAEAEVAARAVGDSDRLARDLGAVLVSLQGHDSTRQMIEHAVEELEAYEEDAAAGAQEGPAAWLAHLPDLCRLTAAQVGGARGRLGEALDGITASLRAVGQRGAALCDQTGRFAGGPGADAPAARVARGVEAATRVLRDHVAQEQAARDAMAGVAGTVQGIAGHVREIQGIGTAVKIIALNALVETERAGDGGRVLAVLAQGMGGLAAEVVRRTGEVSQLLQEISALSAGLGGGEAAGRAPQGDGIAASLEALAAELEERQRRLQREVQELHGRSRALREAVDGIGARVGERAAGLRRLEGLERALQEAGELAGEHAAGAGPAPRPAHRAQALERYTMEAERAIHARVLHGAATGSASAPEAGGGLGSNVELF
jgi:hypothetical protein